MKLLQTTCIAATLMISVPVFAADIAAGQAAFNTKGCINCHGEGGANPVTLVSSPPVPVLAGNSASYISAQLTNFKSGSRQSTPMHVMAGLLDEDEMEDIAAYLNSQK